MGALEGQEGTQRGDCLKPDCEGDKVRNVPTDGHIQCVRGLEKNSQKQVTYWMGIHMKTEVTKNEDSSSHRKEEREPDSRTTWMLLTFGAR